MTLKRQCNLGAKFLGCKPMNVCYTAPEIMKKAILAFATIACLALTAKADYIIKEEIEHSGKVQPISIKVKGTKIRIDVASTNSVITDSVTGDMTVLMHGQKILMKVNAEMVKAQLKALKELSGQKSDAPVEIDLKPTGNHEQIDGFDTEEYTTDVNGVPTSLFIAKSYPDYQKIVAAIYQIENSPVVAEAHGLVIPPDKLPGLPLRTVHTINGQKLVVSITSTQETDLPDTDFSVPADYKELSLPGALKKDAGHSQK
jgi:hypothetical protein